MSGLLAGKVWQSALDPELKPLAAALADIARNDGSKIYPSVAYVCWLLGRSERGVQAGLAKLREAQIISIVRQGGGRGNATEYCMNVEALPTRVPWGETRAEQNGAADAPFEDKPRNLRHERVKQAAPDPLGNRYNTSTVQDSEPESLNLDSDFKTFRIRWQSGTGQHIGNAKPFKEGYAKLRAKASEDEVLDAIPPFVRSRGGKKRLAEKDYQVIWDFLKSEAMEIIEEARGGEEAEEESEGIPRIKFDEDGEAYTEPSPARKRR